MPVLARGREHAAPAASRRAVAPAPGMNRDEGEAASGPRVDLREVDRLLLGGALLELAVEDVVRGLRVEEDVVGDVTEGGAGVVLRTALAPGDPRAEVARAEELVEKRLDRRDHRRVEVDEDRAVVGDDVAQQDEPRAKRREVGGSGRAVA